MTMSEIKRAELNNRAIDEFNQTIKELNLLAKQANEKCDRACAAATTEMLKTIDELAPKYLAAKQKYRDVVDGIGADDGTGKERP